MLGSLANGLPHLLGRHVPGLSVRTLREPMLGPVIPDLLVGCWPTRQRPRSYSELTWIDAHVRAALEREDGATQPELRARLNLSAAALVASVRRLAKHGIIIPCEDARHQDCRWVLNAESRSTSLEIIAVEAKLTRWREATAQAASYLRFADRSYVALDGNQVRITGPILDSVRAANVGLILQHGCVLRRVIEAPTQPPPLTVERVVAMTKLVTKRGGRAFRTGHAS
jgi:hypothetical protein